MTWGWIVAAVLVAAGLTLFVRWYGNLCRHHWHGTLDGWECCWCPKVRTGKGHGVRPADRSELCYAKYRAWDGYLDRSS